MYYKLLNLIVDLIERLRKIGIPADEILDIIVKDLKEAKKKE